ncbi:hypothetical protein QTP88_025764 [Uroleucon formosanum]
MTNATTEEAGFIDNHQGTGEELNKRYSTLMSLRNGRVKRGLINAVGEFENWAFGMVDDNAGSSVSRLDCCGEDTDGEESDGDVTDADETNGGDTDGDESDREDTDCKDTDEFNKNSDSAVAFYETRSHRPTNRGLLDSGT